MATRELTGAHERTDHAGSAPLPPAAVAAMPRLERALAGRSVNDVLAREASSYVRVSPEVQRAVTRYGICTARFAELSMRDRLTPAEFDALADAQDELTRLHEQLAAAGQLHLVAS